MTVLPDLSGRQNSAYRSGCHISCAQGGSFNCWSWVGVLGLRKAGIFSQFSLKRVYSS